ncbi:CLAVATA3/ESR (CLE)-related protein 45 [Camellia lanceoleosa]|uniref:CLAVATA3/ESR (CLE)-related protein 45 n=1 Tax=Camellia lanceoleosa TaxID=1840588 RepID=A0ACC0I410_9ERIC|nr:CLAVATA3/ESR (CLE)-related protein 45 [Camellia lanceoleosa]
MGFSCRTVMFLLCIGFLSIQPERVSSLRSIDLALRWDKGPLFPRNWRILNSVGVEVRQRMPNLAPTPSMAFDPNQSSKRTVRRGSDPIHNRS